MKNIPVRSKYKKHAKRRSKQRVDVKGSIANALVDILAEKIQNCEPDLVFLYKRTSSRSVYLTKLKAELYRVVYSTTTKTVVTLYPMDTPFKQKESKEYVRAEIENLYVQLEKPINPKFPEGHERTKEKLENLLSKYILFFGEPYNEEKTHGGNEERTTVGSVKE